MLASYARTGTPERPRENGGIITKAHLSSARSESRREGAKLELVNLVTPRFDGNGRGPEPDSHPLTDTDDQLNSLPATPRPSPMPPWSTYWRAP